MINDLNRRYAGFPNKYKNKYINKNDWCPGVGYLALKSLVGVAVKPVGTKYGGRAR
jgi:hypothetical protein